MNNEYEAVIVGAGLSGLVAALELEKSNLSYAIFEEDANVGGRVQTDNYNGFLLDRGFQIFLEAYPEARKFLDYGSLNLKPFYSGARVRKNGQFYDLLDPLKNPKTTLNTLQSPIGKISDKLNIAKLKLDYGNKDVNEFYDYKNISTYDALLKLGFSQGFLDDFLSPLFRGIFLEKELATDFSFFEFVFTMLANGDNVVPELGMGQIPIQLKKKINCQNIFFQHKVLEIKENSIIVDEIGEIKAQSVILATNEIQALKLLKSMKLAIKFNAQTCLYFALNVQPFHEPILVLNANKDELINNLTIMSNVSSSYAPPGKHLLSVCLVGNPDLDDDILIDRVSKELGQWYPNLAQDFEFLKLYRINYALPCINDNNKTDPELLGFKNVFLAGDYLENGSINGAMKSGRKAASKAINYLNSLKKQ